MDEKQKRYHFITIIYLKSIIFLTLVFVLQNNVLFHTQGRSASFSDSPLISIVSNNFANLLNQAGLCFVQKEDDRSIELLYKLLEVRFERLEFSCSSVKIYSMLVFFLFQMAHILNEKIYVVSNFEYNVDEFLKCHTELGKNPFKLSLTRSPITHYFYI